MMVGILVVQDSCGHLHDAEVLRAWGQRVDAQRMGWVVLHEASGVPGARRLRGDEGVPYKVIRNVNLILCGPS